MSARKVERLVNLLIMLLSARKPVTIEQIRAIVPGYDQPDDEAFRRMFERDKDELREIGIPLETVPVDAWETEQGYRVKRSSYDLPPVELAPDEAAAVGLAARLWQSGGAGLAEASQRALLKLRAAGIEADPLATAGIEPRVHTSEPALEPVLAAVRARQPLRFDYRRSGTEAVTRRTVEPWGVVHRRGRWYVVGHDRDRQATRAFRLSRIVGDVTPAGPAGSVTVPAGVDLVGQVAALDADQPVGTAVLRVAPGAAWDLRRVATSSVDDADGTSRLQLVLRDLDRFADWVAGFGADVHVEEPPELRAAVVSRLRAVAEGVA